MKTRELDKLKNKLPKNKYRMMLWKRLSNVSLEDIDKVLRGDSNNDDILKAAIELAEEYQIKKKMTKEKINSL